MPLKNIKPVLGIILATTLALPILISLGVWQLNRAEEKQILQNEYDRRATVGPVKITGLLQAAEDLRFYRVTATGFYDPRHQILLDNRTHEGRAGYHVITPIIISGSDTRVLVNRGWVPLGQSRQILPRVAPPKGLQTVTGIATIPVKGGFQLGELPVFASPWETVWPRLDIEHFQKLTGLQTQPATILLEPESEAGGYVRHWKRLDAGIAVHHGYAFQWFALALVLTVMLLLATFKKKNNVNKNKKDNETDADA